jgi:hypothetical protein
MSPAKSEARIAKLKARAPAATGLMGYWNPSIEYFT